MLTTQRARVQKLRLPGPAAASSVGRCSYHDVDCIPIFAESLVHPLRTAAGHCARDPNTCMKEGDPEGRGLPREFVSCRTLRVGDQDPCVYFYLIFCLLGQWEGLGWEGVQGLRKHHG